jgi:hypothetical protein
MSYEVKFEYVRVNLIEHCLNRVKNNWERGFDMWLMCEADMAFGDAYQVKFKEEFNDYINSDTESLLWFAGKNIVFAISGFMAYKNDATLHEVLDFTEKFITAQLNDFGNWCDDIMISIPDDNTSKEDNHS